MNENMKVRKKKSQKRKDKLLENRRLNQFEILGSKSKRKKKLRISIISKIKTRSKKHNVFNEISKDVGKVKLEPENLILLDFIDKKINKS